MESLDHGDAAMLIDGAEPRQYVVLSVTTFWSFVREFPREGLNWAPVRTVS